jgi:hypothetical protein
MINFKKFLLFILFTFYAGIFAAGSVSAQTWTAVTPSTPNQCSSAGQCQCQAGYSVGQANDGNCTMDGWIIGCWNPSTGKCNTCGAGGTIILGTQGCFNNGQGNAGGYNYPATYGPGCSSDAQCPNGGTSGGFSTN